MTLLEDGLQRAVPAEGQTEFESNPTLLDGNSVLPQSASVGLVVASVDHSI